MFQWMFKLVRHFSMIFFLNSDFWEFRESYTDLYYQNVDSFGSRVLKIAHWSNFILWTWKYFFLISIKSRVRLPVFVLTNSSCYLIILHFILKLSRQGNLHFPMDAFLYFNLEFPSYQMSSLKPLQYIWFVNASILRLCNPIKFQ